MAQGVGSIFGARLRHCCIRRPAPGARYLRLSLPWTSRRRAGTARA